ALIVGTNIGGLGTLIASMASLISFKYIAKENRNLRGKYLGIFTASNIIFMIFMLILYFFLDKYFP
ncbi:MAG: citrate transporter, partial [Roseburia sp.]|nr:citrate transporter [Roseburia sp.]